jgi:hypothetical protein
MKIQLRRVVLIRATWRHLPEDDNHHSHRRGNLKSYKIQLGVKIVQNWKVNSSMRRMS